LSSSRIQLFLSTLILGLLALVLPYESKYWLVIWGLVGLEASITDEEEDI
jgi:hypothetical protein